MKTNKQTKHNCQDTIRTNGCGERVRGGTVATYGSHCGKAQRFKTNVLVNGCERARAERGVLCLGCHKPHHFDNGMLICAQKTRRKQC